MSTVKIEIKHWLTGELKFECGVSASLSIPNRLGAAIKLALLARADLAGANLARANLANTNLANVYLAGANLADANLANSNLANAYLARADLSGANLARANLARANLADANLADANLSGAILFDAILAGADGVIDAGVPNGFRVVGWLKDGALTLRAGCKTLSAGEARDYWRGREDRAECDAALTYIEAVATLRGWVK